MLPRPSIAKRLLTRPSTLVGLFLTLASATAWITSYFVNSCCFWQVSSTVDGFRYLGIYNGDVFFASETEPVLQTPPVFPLWRPNFDRDRHELEMLCDRARQIAAGFGFHFGGLSAGRGVVKPPRPGSISLHYTARRRGNTLTVLATTIPLWLCALLGGSIGTLPLMLERRSRLQQQSRKNRGLCTNCGYDLRASTDRCPECGQSVSPPASPLQ